MIPKLVRDGIPAKIMARGALPVLRHLDPTDKDEVLAWLDAKLVEEVHEYIRDGDPLELVDVLSVVMASWRRHGRTLAELVEAATIKRADVGSFDNLTVLERIEEPNSDG